MNTRRLELPLPVAQFLAGNSPVESLDLSQTWYDWSDELEKFPERLPAVTEVAVLIPDLEGYEVALKKFLGQVPNVKTLVLNWATNARISVRTLVSLSYLVVPFNAKFQAEIIYILFQQCPLLHTLDVAAMSKHNELGFEGYSTDLDNKNCLFGTIDAPTKSVNALTFSTNGRYLASGSDDMTLCVYDVKHQFSIVWTYKGRSPFTAATWLGDSLIAGTGDGEVSLFHPVTFWSSTKQEKVLVAELYAPVASLQVSKSGSSLLVCAGTRASLMTQKKSGQWRLKYHLDHPSTFEEIEEFGSPDGFAEPPLVATSAHFLQSDKECIVTYLHHGICVHVVTALAYVFPTGGSQMLATGDRNCELNTRIKVWIEDSDELDDVAIR
ncbi:hypothetical protein BDP27DRAFT_1436293 [Rhodocollybia butyracea]|uniref:Uncharacterized protein n=1 Tax=Rhodocollybia butyracea TaxID=206335 RepID=A0A9P5P4E7_9AGAR|nr:hypothetical protein BDP27DRAFT_1436293 [Rhodocollybia butyracea]